MRRLAMTPTSAQFCGAGLTLLRQHARHAPATSARSSCQALRTSSDGGPDGRAAHLQQKNSSMLPTCGHAELRHMCFSKAGTKENCCCLLVVQSYLRLLPGCRLASTALMMLTPSATNDMIMPLASFCAKPKTPCYNPASTSLGFAMNVSISRSANACAGTHHVHAADTTYPPPVWSRHLGWPPAGCIGVAAECMSSMASLPPELPAVSSACMGSGPGTCALAQCCRADDSG
jgi:hypothetical protein